MRKRKCLPQNKDGLQYNLGLDDLLSRLPDEILVSILSSFPLKDAAVTSSLSRRWRYLWCQTNRLVFDDWDQWKVIDTCPTAERYMSWVNQIIDQHKSPTIDEFRIRFGFDENAKGAIDKWIKYAISKNVQTLELDLLGSNGNWRNYCFPNKIFDRKCGSSLKRQSFSDLLMEIKFLKSLFLAYVDVDDEGVKIILNNCPVLEHLRIFGSRKLVKPEIHGKGLVLKNLAMVSCSGLESVEICDSNIVFFKCSSKSTTLRLDNLQKLEKIHISKRLSWKELSDMFCEISCVPYLQVLDVCLYGYDVQEAIELLPFPKLQKLKQLTIKVAQCDEDRFPMLPFLLEACPNIRRLTILRINLIGAEKTNGEVRQMAIKPHQRLEVVEMFEYHGWTSDVELFRKSCLPIFVQFPHCFQ